MSRKTFLAQYQKVPVEEFQNSVSETPLVSVSVTTYGHEKYIAKCLDGILMQQTNFDFEILVGEDASADGTRDICIEYAKKYPDKIKLFLHSRENNIQIYGKPTARFNSAYNSYAAKGKYLAICEGDDFWIDPLKLQKQVDFLESNDDYGMVFSDVVMIDKNNDEIPETDFHRKIRSLYKSGSIFWDLLENNFINTLTICVRIDLHLDYLDRFFEDFAYDYRFWLHDSSYTKIKYLNEKTAAYRVHNMGMSRNDDFFIKRTPLVHQSAMVNYMSLIKFDSKSINRPIFSRTVFNILKSKNLSKQEKSPTWNMLKKSPKLIMYVAKWVVTDKIGKSVLRKIKRH